MKGRGNRRERRGKARVKKERSNEAKEVVGMLNGEGRDKRKSRGGRVSEETRDIESDVYKKD